MEDTSVREPRVYDVVVVGAGIMGSCSAYECAKRGLAVLLLEQFDFLHRRGSSHGESRIIRRTYPEDWYTEMMPRAYELWEEASKESGYSPLTITGSLDFGEEDCVDLQELISACKKHSVPHELLASSELQERFPGLSFPERTIGVYCPEGGVLHATKACSMFQQLAVKHGAQVLDRVKVLGLTKESGVVGGAGSSIATEGTFPHEEMRDVISIQTTKGAFHCQSCVLACGAWSAALAKSISGLDLPVQPLQVYVAYWRVNGEWRRALDAQDGCPVFLHYGKEDLVYSTPILDYQGLVKFSSHHGWPCDPDDRPSGKPVMEPLQKWMGKWLEGRVDLEPAMVEACMYSMTPDQDFILDLLPLKETDHGSFSGKSHSLPRVVVAAGFSGHGFKFGPLVGSVVADLIQIGDCLQVPMAKFKLSRFEGGNPGNVRKSGPQVKPAPVQPSLEVHQ